MSEYKIESLSIAGIQKYAKPAHIAVHKGILIGQSQIGQQRLLIEDPLRVDAILFLFCTHGSSRAMCNQREFTIESNSLMVIPPRTIIDASTNTRSHDESSFEGWVLMLDQSYMAECNLNLKKLMQVMMTIMEQGIIHLSDEEASRLTGTLTVLQQHIRAFSNSEFGDEVIRSMVEATTYLCLDLFMEHIATEKGTKSHTTARAEEYFRNFIQALSEHYLERQSVTWYADRLCISSRYLTTIVRRVSGLSVTDWMNRYILMEAKYLLKYSGLSIQEVAYRLSFPNQSFFGKYFKQHTGMSPSTYRQRQ